jgi:hypothetical protein
LEPRSGTKYHRKGQIPHMVADNGEPMQPLQPPVRDRSPPKVPQPASYDPPAYGPATPRAPRSNSAPIAVLLVAVATVLIASLAFVYSGVQSSPKR